ncbi:serglycin [Tiliqua scincoides]|uniref:serglycin n=1 Tax=Tiliqua scincoides TaxID=71010 RepID=UPI0034620A57
MQMHIGRNGRIFMALCVILFMGCTVQGHPVQRGRYMRVRCIPNAHSSDCVEEKGPLFVIPNGGASMVPPINDPLLMKKFQDHPGSFTLSGDEDGSGNEIEPESGSGTESELDDRKLFEFFRRQPDQDLKLKLTDESLFLQKQTL